ncbi:MAG: anthranilate synthase component I [Lachnospiraceae bacterium]|nr:anthranilate synthase component I [Lachnospiraceae bacterium]MDD6448859.1 anthranilate synthase component I [Lachnospiraceae bacterium]MDD6450866.1 anthranilate synthase component I [Lachnospiraceae bacterium]MDD6577967.1 anthranilate synthase component I [Lachnospiraceae bacterium]
MKQTSYEEVKKIAASGDYKRIPVTREILSDIRTPVETLRALLNVTSHCFLLESVEDSRQMGRYTFLGYDPTMEISCKDHLLTIKAGGTIQMKVDHPGPYIQKIIQDNRSPRLPGLPSLTGGLVGYFSYDYIQYGEPALKLSAKDENKFCDVNLMLFDKLICYDNYRQKILLIVNILTEDMETAYQKALLDLNVMEEIIRKGKPKQIQKGHLLEPLKPKLSLEEFTEKVEKIKYHIHEGDIFQLVFSNPMEARYEGSLLDTYRVLRTTNPSPYMFYFSGDDVEIAGSSPETLVKVSNGEIRTFPLAGTRPRGRDEKEDQKLEKELLSDEKERAEHNMLVDLGRNDLGRLCKFGSVQVEKYMAIEKYSHVMHIGSEVKGILREDKKPIDAIDSVLPAGTLSGAPKFRAMELINELENDRRGIYGGAIGYVDFTGNLDVCIAIRLAYKRNGKVFVRSGAGIVADSIAKNEYKECQNKAKAVVEAIQKAEEEE